MLYGVGSKRSLMEQLAQHLTQHGDVIFLDGATQQVKHTKPHTLTEPLKGIQSDPVQYGHVPLWVPNLPSPLPLPL